MSDPSFRRSRLGALVGAFLIAAACSAPPPDAAAERASRIANVRLRGGVEPGPAVESWALVVAARQQTRMLLSATGIQLADHPGACPTVRELVDAGFLNPGTSDHDPWGRPFTVECDAEAARVCSNGRDGRAGSHDDVCLPRAPL